MKINSVAELLSTLEDLTLLDEIFRGQLEDWPLLPSIGRHAKQVEGFDDWRGFHEYIISRFTRLARPHFLNGFGDEASAWIHAQHHGVPTRLLDFSTNPLKALFFAVNDPNHDTADGVFWALTLEGWREDLSVKHREYWETQLVPFLPEQLNPRLTAQEGCFVSYPLPSNKKPLVAVDVLAKDHQIVLTKFIIPKNSKPNLRRELAVLGCRYRLLFPDADGVARGIKMEDLES